MFDPIKYIPLFRLQDSYLSVGGEIRLRYEYTNNPEWGRAPQDDHGVFLQRYVLHTDLHITRYFRAFGQLRSALSDGRAGGPSPVEEGELDVQQLLGDLVLPVGKNAEAMIRGGRQEIRLGSERLVSVSEGLNIRRRFDAVRAFALLPGWNTTALAAYLTENKEGTFNDGFNTDTALWGAYAVRNLAFGTPLNVDLYYLGLDDENAAYEQGLGSETRHTIGTRLWGRSHAWDWNWELAYQYGTFDGADITAWTVATDTGYTFAKLPWTPRFAFNANVASGDRDAEDPSLETFNPLLPRGTTSRISPCSGTETS